MFGIQAKRIEPGEIDAEVHAELTTQEVADLLHVSRPFVISLLEAGEIPFRLVGTHRCIRYDDLKDYQRRSSSSSRAAADELSDLGQELGT